MMMKANVESLPVQAQKKRVFCSFTRQVRVLMHEY